MTRWPNNLIKSPTARLQGPLKRLKRRSLLISRIQKNHFHQTRWIRSNAIGFMKKCSDRVALQGKRRTESGCDLLRYGRSNNICPLGENQKNYEERGYLRAENSWGCIFSGAARTRGELLSISKIIWKRCKKSVLRRIRRSGQVTYPAA